MNEIEHIHGIRYDAQVLINVTSHSVRYSFPIVD
ncbi:hypothetical protein T11_18336 [Trichinella zimbabwensis]|uniref:Uncharacterized protein n=1 Tax=Trichinella zimbabwensis TaxID=268475 RepID=A0A0V1GGP7_9BILA|nr:hypothetical protein T11_18336 [Trichinella zimbabwensis]